MSIGFRKSIFGFNCDDVMSYIERSQKNYAEKETIHNEKIEELNINLSELTEKLSILSAEKEKIAHQLAEYTEKYDEIGRLSENIGKLYLVAQANAQAIMKNSAENSELAKQQVQNNLGSIEEAHRSLDGLKTELLETTAGFARKVDGLMNSLDETRGKIENNNTANRAHNDDFATVFEMLSK